MEPYFGVASFFININTGDAAIHILYSRADALAMKRVERAILLDGGSQRTGVNHGVPHPNIDQTIIDIEEQFQCQGRPNAGRNGDRPRLIFDAFVVSHWDDDHAEGVMWFLLRDVEQQIQLNIPLNQITLSRAWYEQPGNIPQSYFYAPTWKHLDHVKPTWGAVVWSSQFSNYFSTFYDTTIVPGDGQDQLMPNDAMLWITPDPGQPNQIIKKLLLMRIGMELLGRNFFAREHPNIDNGVRWKFTNISELLASVPPECPIQPEPVNSNVPGFYCVGTNAFVLGGVTSVDSDTYKNETSICNLVIWGRSKSVSLYTAGDAPENLERHVANWIGYAPTDAKGVRIMKVSHHGGDTSSPRELWSHLKPFHVVCSAGDHATYCHPRFEILLDIQSWYTYGLTPLQPDSNPLYLTQYPFYLRDEPAARRMGLSALTKHLEDMFVEYQAWGAVRTQNNLGIPAMLWLEPAYHVLQLKAPPDTVRTEIFREIRQSLMPEMLSAYRLMVQKTYKVRYIQFETDGSDEDDALENLAKIKYESSDAVINEPRQRPRVLARSELDFPKTHIRLLREISKGLSFSADVCTDPNEWDLLTREDFEALDTNLTYVTDAHLIVPEGSDLAKKPSPNMTVLSKTSSLHPFLFAVASQQFKLQQQPKPSEAVAFSDDDEWQKWMRLVLGSSSGHLQFTIDSWPPALDQLGDYKIRTEPLANNRVLTLSSKDAPDCLGVDLSSVKILTSMGRIIPFSMSASIPNDPKGDVWTLGEIAQFVGYPESAAIKLLGSLKLKLNTNKTARNALWFTAGVVHSTNVRLEFTLQDDMYEQFKSWLGSDSKSFSIQKISVIARRNATLSYGTKQDAMASSGELAFVVALELCQAPYTASITISQDAVRLRLQKDPSQPGESLLADLVKWAIDTMGAAGFECKTWVDQANSFLSAVKPRAIDIIMGYKDGKPQEVQALNLTLQVALKRGTPSAMKATESVVFFITFGWSKTDRSFLKGALWTAPDPKSIVIKPQAMPFWEAFLELVPDVDGNVLDHIDLKKLLDLDTLPAGIPTLVTKAELQIDQSGIGFSGIIACTDPTKDSKIPILAVDSLALDCHLMWANDKGVQATAASWFFSLGFDILLLPSGNPATTSTEDSALKDAVQFRGDVRYATVDGWKLHGRMDGLKVSHLSQFWDNDSRDGVLALLGNLRIDYLELEYLYEKGDNVGGKSFSFSGALSFGAMQLRLNFDYKDLNWTFAAGLGLSDAATGTVKVGDVLQGLLGDDTPDIPGAVLDIVLAKPGKENEVLQFKCSSIEGPRKSQILMLTGSIHISSISLCFMQWRDKSWKSDVPSKRVIKVSVGDIGPFNAPIVGELKQPFDQLVYMWLSDKATAIVTKPEDKVKPGITKGEFDSLSSKLDHKQDKLFYKMDKAVDKVLPETVVIEPGSHFMIVATDSEGVQSAVLDYVFGRPKQPAKADASQHYLPQSEDITDVWLFKDEETKNEEASKAPFKLSVGPLTFENIGLQYIPEKKRLGIVLDAGFLMGPIGIQLLGFCLSVQIGSQQPTGLDLVSAQGGISVSSPEVELAGLIVSFDRPPLTVAGGFMKVQLNGGTYYAGGLIIGFKPWMIQAMGVYGKAPKRPAKQRFMLTNGGDDDYDEQELQPHNRADDTFTMVFVIFKLDGPLFTVGFADISGLTGGVGVNTNVRLPNAETVLEFPFVKPSGTSTKDGPLNALMSLLSPASGDPWFSPREDSFWVAAGLKAKAFQMLTVDAVAVVQLNPDVQLGIYGVAVCDVPSEAASVKFAHVELGIACTLDIKAGVFKFEAQLSPRSYILHESCHLTGGMALFSWFGDNEMAGDWVMTIGGYHQAFNRPPQYPNPPRLGINWSLNDNLRITGEAYFAITPRMCMGGGRLHAALSLGSLSAWFDAFLDFLINYRPFHFDAVGGISVGVRFSMDLWLVTVRISAEISATLTVAGPPMGGVVHVDFWVFGFDIEFGDRSGAGVPPPISLGEFKALALKSAGGSSNGTGLPLGGLEGSWINVTEEDDGEIDGEEVNIRSTAAKAFLFNCSQGLVPDGNASGNKKAKAWLADKPEGMWMVRGGYLEFTITTGFALSDGMVHDLRGGPTKKDMPIEVNNDQKKIFAMPMAVDEVITSTIDVTISNPTGRVVMLRDDPKRNDEEWFVRPLIKAVPLSIWGQYKATADPMQQGNHASELLDSTGTAKTTKLAMGLTIQPPLPYMAREKIPKFNLVDDFKQTVNGNGYPFLDKTDADPRWAPRAISKDWDAFKKEWRRQDESRPRQAVSIWAARLNYPSDVLSGARPKALLDRFNDMVPALPMVAIGAS